MKVNCRRKPAIYDNLSRLGPLGLVTTLIERTLYLRSLYWTDERKHKRCLRASDVCL